MVLKYDISTSGISEDFVIRIWEAIDKDNPVGFVYEQTLVEKDSGGIPTPGAGHQVIEPIMVNGLDKVVHVLRMFGAVSNTLYHEANLEPRASSITGFSPIRFKIGDGGTYTPPVNTGVFGPHPSLVGLTTDGFIVFRNIVGALQPTNHYTFDGTAGTITLNEPDIFAEDEEITIQAIPGESNEIVNDSVVAKYFGPTEANADIFVDITADISYIPAHLRKILRFNGAFTYSFDDDVPKGYGFVFNNYGNPEATAHIAFNNAPLKWGATTKSTIDLAAFSSACFTFDGTFWNVVYLVSSTGNTTAGSIMATGTLVVGDVGAGDPDYEVVHNLGIVGDYMVLWSVMSILTNSLYPASRFYDNDISGTWFWHPVNKPNRFVLTLQERAPGFQNMNIKWAILKM